MRNSTRFFGALTLTLCSGALLLGCASGAAEKRVETEGPALSSEQQSIQQDHIDEISRLCQRKAGLAVPRCWSDEYQRTGKKFEAQVTLMLVISPGGQAEQVKVVASSAKSEELVKCLIDEAKSWSYPEGKVAAAVNCSFFLRSSM